MTSHPRLAFVLTGDGELFQETLTTHVLGELLAPLGGALLPRTVVTDRERERAQLRAAHEIYDKVIPPGHRFLLGPLPPEHRLEARREPKRARKTLLESVPVRAGGGALPARLVLRRPKARGGAAGQARSLIDFQEQVDATVQRHPDSAPLR